MNWASRILLFFAFYLLAAFLLSGCAPQTMKFEGKRYTTDQVEQIIESRLELQNDGKDYDVRIIEDLED